MSSESPLPASVWRKLAAAHKEQITPLTTAFRERRARGQLHPVLDFLFTYYPHSPAKLEQWHPAVGERLLLDGEPLPSHFTQKHYFQSNDTISLNPSVLRPKDRERYTFSHRLLNKTASRPPNFGCYGLHEWAMVYRSENTRHRERAPLRLPAQEIAQLVESQTLACSHFDATRFFTPAATPLNRLSPTLETREDLEQPGCIHANMDLYKWAFKAMPWIGSELLLQTFFLALELRELDMRASPYDLSDYGYSAIPIETTAGRTEYATRQQQLSEKAVPLRAEVLTALERLLAHCPSECPREQDFS